MWDCFVLQNHPRNGYVLQRVEGGELGVGVEGSGWTYPCPLQHVLALFNFIIILCMHVCAQRLPAGAKNQGFQTQIYF